MTLPLHRHRSEWQPRCDECGAYGEWIDAEQCDLCEVCEEARINERVDSTIQVVQSEPSD